MRRLREMRDSPRSRTVMYIVVCVYIHNRVNGGVKVAPLLVILQLVIPHWLVSREFAGTRTYLHAYLLLCVGTQRLTQR